MDTFQRVAHALRLIENVDVKERNINLFHCFWFFFVVVTVSVVNAILYLCGVFVKRAKADQKPPKSFGGCKGNNILKK